MAWRKGAPSRTQNKRSCRALHQPGCALEIHAAKDQLGGAKFQEIGTILFPELGLELTQTSAGNTQVLAYKCTSRILYRLNTRIANRLLRALGKRSLGDNDSQGCTKLPGFDGNTNKSMGSRQGTACDKSLITLNALPQLLPKLNCQILPCHSYCPN